MSGRPWSEADRQLVRAHYKQRSTARLAQQLGRSETAVRLQADALGLCKRRRIPEGLLEFIRSRHAAGDLDTDIHAAWIELRPEAAVTRESVRNYRYRMGLPVNAERRLERRRAAHRKQLQTLRIDSLRVLAQRRVRRVASQAGLPLDFRPLEVRTFLALRAGGYMTRQEIAHAIGVRSGQQRSWFKCRYGSQSALDNLVDRGLVRRSNARTRKLGGKGRSAYEYWVPLDVLKKYPAKSQRLA